ncbi:SDR family NAD(P)-dependent oxidoreductase [Actinomycetospora sp. TBRC 11914]|uniref:SDR family NAD(P)-dependent oxidoreductase n=1 Tax=Actinomycetospora sp. TBRC 11914 TaxID=2729387 RepID=UPI00145C633D|nr:SDR family NAD(P)-dependent oxidoreductase [Actinomycetospora sp. TBRC 11914]NMO88260.1 SDR family oxidoreductase [Actinomycetospora sp. TBRC 11914]
MQLDGSVALVTGGASGLGLATAMALASAGAQVVVADLPSSNGEKVAADLGGRFVPADVTDESQVRSAVDAAVEAGPLRAVVHCAGISSFTRVVEKSGEPGSMADFERVVRVNLFGSFNVLRVAGAAMAAHTPPVDGERGAVVMTASVAAFEGQIGQMAYTASKGGVVAMTICAARDLSSKLIRVNTIAPGLFQTPLFDTLSDTVKESLAASVPHPRRMGDPAEYAKMAISLLENPMVNGETVRLDGAIRMGPR